MSLRQESRIGILRHMPRSSDGPLTRPSSSPKDSVPPPTVLIAGSIPAAGGDMVEGHGRKPSFSGLARPRSPHAQCRALLGIRPRLPAYRHPWHRSTMRLFYTGQIPAWSLFCLSG